MDKTDLAFGFAAVCMGLAFLAFGVAILVAAIGGAR